MAQVEIAGATLRLLPERAAWFEAAGTLLLADVHLGKAQSFRRLGVPVPEATTAGTLARLTRAIELTGARHVVVLGDLLHAAIATPKASGAATLAAVAEWRRAHGGVHLTLVRGNHDAKAGLPPPAWDVQVVDEPWPLGPFALRHHPLADDSGRYVLAGHLHPAVVLAGRGPGSVRVPCFHFGAALGVLPAFGEFTGSAGVRAATGDRLFAIAGDAVREVGALHCPAT